MQWTMYLEKHSPELVINAAAFTDVDRCEEEAALAFDVNALGARNAANACLRIGSMLMHISTDYVFNGHAARPYVENDPPGPLNVYGVTKLAGEFFSRSICSHHYIIRTSGLYGLNPCIGKGNNFVDTMLHLGSPGKTIKVVGDEVLTPTFTEDLAEQIRLLLEKPPPFGIYHATNSGECSWYDFAKAVFDFTKKEVELVKITSKEWNAPARRPRYSVLENAGLKKNNCDSMPGWKDALGRYLSKKGIE